MWRALERLSVPTPDHPPLLIPVWAFSKGERPTEADAYPAFLFLFNTWHWSTLRHSARCRIHLPPYHRIGVGSVSRSRRQVFVRCSLCHANPVGSDLTVPCCASFLCLTSLSQIFGCYRLRAPSPPTRSTHRKHLGWSIGVRCRRWHSLNFGQVPVCSGGFVCCTFGYPVP